MGTALHWEDRIEVNPNVLLGKPVVKGTRLSVELVIDSLAQGWSDEEILGNYPQLSSEDIHACLAYAGNRLRSEKVYPLHNRPSG